MRGLMTAAFLCLLTACAIPVLQVAEVAMHGKSAFDLYRAIISNPEELLTLTGSIREHYKAHDPATRYAGLENKTAATNGWFDDGWLALDYIRLGPAPCDNLPQGCFFVELKKLSFSQCISLANHDEINGLYYRVELNGDPVSIGGLNHEVLEECKIALPLMQGRNEIKYISY
ncbi:hypothetical protein SAMN05660284_00227 [Formivibrio citricus]|uniref:Uncharacterized protein n=2 Tax=Formivibrio citricus TaxID=83765 RepID=A0A1I4VCF8_9NEIS|nr:hypothetical protein SAMN05660284_00227 [Formivibrio citricus]